MAHFDALSDVDFEDLVADLLEAEHRRKYRTFAKGRDAGIDLLGTTKRGANHAVQVAHYPNSTFAQLLAKAKAEREKLDKLSESLAGYWFVTSKPLSRANVQSLAAELAPYIRNESHILSGGDVRALLRKHDHVAARHVKSWIPDSATLMKALNLGAHSRTEALISSCHESVPVYVETSAFGDASKILDEQSVCIVSGEPGIGKTTLAQMLLLDYTNRAVRPFELATNQLDDAWAILDLEEPQIFYYDDFLGRTSLIQLREDERHLLRFMNEVARRENKWFILTTREYVLQQAEERSETLAEGIRRDRKYILKLQRYSEYQRGRILYNHVFHAMHVTDEDRRSLTVGRAYAAIVSHQNYNPRLIRGMVDESLMSSITAPTFALRCLKVLDTPEILWRKPFEKGLDEKGRSLLVALIGIESAIRWSECERLFVEACRAREIVLDGGSFEETIHVLQDSFLKVSTWPNEDVRIDFINPSLQDFLKRYVKRSSVELSRAIESVAVVDQVEWLWDFAEYELTRSVGLSDGLQDALARSFESSLSSRRHSVFGTPPMVEAAGVRQLDIAKKICLNRAEVRSELGKKIQSRVEAFVEMYRVDSAYSWPSPELAGWMFRIGVLSRANADELTDQICSKLSSWEALESLDECSARFAEFVREGRISDLRNEVRVARDFLLGDPGEHFDDMDEFERFESVLNLHGLEPAEEELALARGEMEEKLMEGFEPDSDYHREEEWSDSGRSHDELDDLFSRFR